MGFIPNKENILTYWKILLESSPKSEIFKYIFRRLIGIRKNFSKDVYINNGEGTLNCGRLMNNCSVACSQFEKDLLPLFKNTKIAIDIGANIGRHTISIAKHADLVLACEPDKGSLDLLKQNVILNNLKEKIIIIPKACGIKEGAALFYRDADFPTSNSITIKKNKNMTAEEVIVDTIDNITNGLKIDLIKIDIEGGELTALKGATKTITECLPRIIFEAWDLNAANEIVAYLSQFGYIINRIDEYNYLAEAK